MKRLRRYPDKGILGGVCEGLGKYFDIDPSIIRIVWAVAMLVFGTGILLYIIAWICIPNGEFEESTED